MAFPSLSVIVPTIGRSTLIRTLRRLQEQLDDNDEVIVVSDGKQPDAEKIFWDVAELHWRYYTGPEHHYYGNPQRDFAMQKAQGDYLMFVDDDDYTADGAILAIKKAIREDYGRCFLFRMKGPGETLHWAEPNMQAQFGSPMFVVPREMHKLYFWNNEGNYGSDQMFIRKTIAKFGVDPIFVDKVICIVKDQ